MDIDQKIERGQVPLTQRDLMRWYEVASRNQTVGAWVDMVQTWTEKAEAEVVSLRERLEKAEAQREAALDVVEEWAQRAGKAEVKVERLRATLTFLAEHAVNRRDRDKASAVLFLAETEEES